MSGKELQLIVIDAEALEGEESSECFWGQVVEGIIAETKPFYIVQALGEISDQFQRSGF